MHLKKTRYFIVPPVGALLGCVLLFLWSGLPDTVACCGSSMGFPFSCLLLLLITFSLGSAVLFFTRKSGVLVSLPAARFQHLATLILSTEIRAGFVFSLVLASALIVNGSMLVFLLSFGFNWSALVLGCLSLLLGLGIGLWGLCFTRS